MRKDTLRSAIIQCILEIEYYKEQIRNCQDNEESLLARQLDRRVRQARKAKWRIETIEAMEGAEYYVLDGQMRRRYWDHGAYINEGAPFRFAVPEQERVSERR